jgi:hypothetical protein
MSTDPQIITRRDGVDAYGLYLDYVMYNPDNGQLQQQLRYFLADNILSKYARVSGTKRAAWNTYTCGSHEAAKEMLAKAIEALPVNTVEIHTPLIVELTGSEVAASTKGEAPAARFAGTAAVQAATGKIDDTTWRPKGWTA